MTSTGLEIDMSDSELAEIMPHVPHSQTLIPITMSSVSLLTSEVLDLQSVEIPKPDIPTATKKSRKPRISKKAALATSSENSVDGPSVATPSKSGTPGKSATTDQQFTLGLTRECFTQEELAINPLTQIFIENSRVTNNELIKYQAVKSGLLDYKCYGKGCPTKDGNWRRKLGFLILVRNNNRDSDLRMTNLSLLCPNCYCQEKGSQSFEKVKKDIVRTCTFCLVPLDTKYNSDKCGRCAWQIKNQIQKSTNIDRLSRAFGTEVDGLSASNMAILMNSSILDEQSGADIGTGLHKYSGAGVSSSRSGMRLTARSVCNPVELKIENSAALKRLFMELSEQA